MRLPRLAALPLLVVLAATAVPQDAPAPDPAREQLFADRAAEDALAKVRSRDVVEVLDGLERLSRARSGAATVGVLDAVLARTELHVAEFAGHALAAADPEGAIADLARRLANDKYGSSGPLVQIAAALSGLPTDPAVNLLMHDRLAGSREVAVRRETIRALGRHRSARGTDLALQSLSARDAGLRSVACVALGRIGDPRAAGPLLSALEEKDGGTGGFAAIALGRLEDETILRTLAGRFSAGNTDDKAKALVACARPAHVEKLAAMVRSGSDDARIAACAALGKLGTTDVEVQENLLAAMLGGDRWVRAAAFHALGRCATKELGPQLERRMGQRDEERQAYVFEIAGDIGWAPCLSAIEKAMWSEKNDVLRRTAQDAFWRIRDPEAMRSAEERIRSVNGKFLERAAELLGARRNRNGFDLALELLDAHRGDDRSVFLVELALERQTGHFFGPDTSVWRDWIGKNPNFFEKEQAAVERQKWREDFLAENTGTGTPATEIAVQRALDYLARHQDPSGAFDPQTFRGRCADDGCPTNAGPRIQMEPASYTALCALAYFGAGFGPESGRYSGVLSRALEYLLSRQMTNGDYTPNDLTGGYTRPLVLQAYAEAASATGDPQFLPFVQRGVDFIACIQSDKGGWRYRVVDNANDTSVVSWVLFGAKSAEKAGARVRRSVYEGCDLVLSGYQTRPVEEREDFLHDIDPNYAFEVGQGTTYEFHTGYQNAHFDKKYATTALGLMSRILLGYRRSHPFSIGSANKVLATQVPRPPRNDDWKSWRCEQEYGMYHLYYGTLAMHQMGGRYFRDWNKSLKSLLPATQETSGCLAGSWAGWNYDGFFCRLYTTAMGALTLETYYRYAPVLQD